ncbi:LacI family DNA-binding transcriptional regulator [Streptococcus ictaluri]|uniref:HTH-type transcriptional regulator MalR n=1 Tax=Streptococcus ictaluri 707-05 TaxID=764299 RepID=G5JZN4_9STRE|nr:LacI family DNA-binding transcriptional regulator [Streptococcus ictaluri]EHI70984.1 putative HTH-type transcriptional regulator MalR [Streptococcus ictaluri 707-05]
MVTIKDVARLAGVSPSTASRAMHDNAMISQATKDRVRKAMEALDYSPNYSAQNLVKKQSNTVGIILPVRESQESLGNNPFFMQIIQGIAAICTDHGYMVSLATGRSEEELLKNVQNMIRSGNIGKLVFLYSKTDDQVFEFVKNQSVDCVVVGQSALENKGNAKFVDNDNRQAGYDAANFLFQKGCRQISFVYTDMAELVQSDRYQGYHDLMTEHELTPHAFHLNNSQNQLCDQESLAYVKENPDRAYITCDDLLAISLQRLLKQVESNEDTKMISFNNSMLAELASPALTSVPYQLGEKAAELVLTGTDRDSETVLIPHQIIERASTSQ